ncbi:unnamed protein product [Moneuplotes crassus]|uniref:Uncharacterized protein n=1 Tax=Euplotes crassus TaxID=5936 RepID=A0AAD1U3T6_EUPCR|nr:unnamed protein product [Moneuplotes crassus]
MFTRSGSSKPSIIFMSEAFLLINSLNTVCFRYNSIFEIVKDKGKKLDEEEYIVPLCDREVFLHETSVKLSKKDSFLKNKFKEGWQCKEFDQIWLGIFKDGDGEIKSLKTSKNPSDLKKMYISKAKEIFQKYKAKSFDRDKWRITNSSSGGISDELSQRAIKAFCEIYSICTKDFEYIMGDCSHYEWLRDSIGKAETFFEMINCFSSYYKPAFSRLIYFLVNNCDEWQGYSDKKFKSHPDDRLCLLQNSHRYIADFRGEGNSHIDEVFYENMKSLPLTTILYEAFEIIQLNHN